MYKRFWLSRLLDSCYFVTKLSLALILRALYAAFDRGVRSRFFCPMHRIHKWRTRGRKLVPSHESEALQDKQFLQMKTFSELAEVLARLSPKMTLCAFLFKYDYVACLQTLMVFFSLIFCWQTKRTCISLRKQDDFVRFRSIRRNTTSRR